jgi:hypothetical protein
VYASRSVGISAFSPILLATFFVWTGVFAAQYEWTFSQGNLNSALGNGSLQYADSASQTLSSFGISDGSSVPHMNGQATSFMRVPAFADGANGYNATFADSGPNGGGSYVNQYTLVYDILSPGSLNWAPFFNTDPANGNDADFYISPDGALGIGAMGYSAPGTIMADQWYRVAFAADLAANTVSYYVNGVQVHTRTGSGLLDGRFSLYSNVDAGPDLRLFNEGDIAGQFTHELLVSSIYATDRTLSGAEIAALGGPNAMGVVVPEPNTWVLIGVSAGLMLIIVQRRNRN